MIVIVKMIDWLVNSNWQATEKPATDNILEGTWERIPQPEVLLDIKLYWGTGPYSYPFLSPSLLHNALLGYRNSPCLTHYTTVPGRKFDMSFGKDINS